MKEKYTITPQSRVRKDATKEGPKKIEVRPTKVEWKKAAEVIITESRLTNEEEELPHILMVEPAQR